jgi:hypothetical protein
MLLQCLILLATIQGAPPALTAPEIVERMVSADNARLAALSGYTGTRRYRFENKSFNKRAEMIVRVTCDGAGVKRFEVITENGSGLVRKRVLRKMIDAEEEASRKGDKEQTRIIPANYDFRLLGTELLDGRSSYVLEINPKTDNKFLIRGRIWVDAEDFAIARIEGQPARNPSFWIRSVQVAHRYERCGQFWLPVRNESRAQARIFGANAVDIDYFDYVTTVRNSHAARGAVGE